MQNNKITTIYTILKFDELDTREIILIKKSQEALKSAYAPYSKFHVGCAIELTDGTIIQASNQENASYGLTVCAERNALFAAGSAGKKDQVRTIAISGSPKDQIGEVVPVEKENIVSPCGACRQVIKEYEDLSGEKIVILFITNADRIYRIEGIESLLPFAFGPNNLK